MSTIAGTTPPKDSADKTRVIFDRFFEKEIAYPSNQVDAVIGFFVRRGFEEQAALSVGSVLLQQAKIDGVNVLELLDTLNGLDSVKLSNLIVSILNANRSAISKLGLRNQSTTNPTEARNILY
tara:strand:+ start:2795 stop:3163 length:369 start_codon:yes stop_codon:yes gene_type:complete